MRPLLSTVLLLASLRAALSLCGPKCKFRFCTRPKGPRFLLRSPNTSIGPGLCRAGRRELRDIFATGEAVVSTSENGPFLNISDYAPDGLSPRFKPDFFKTFKLAFTKKRGVGRKIAFGNQWMFSDGLCVVLPIVSFEIARKNGGFRTVNSLKERDCVSFVTVAPTVLVELSWNTRDNLDLEVVEPDGDVVSRENPSSENGELNNDNNQECGNARTGKEAITYGSEGSTENGNYVAVVRHTRNCAGDRTQWRVRVVVGGELVLAKKGFSKGDGGVIVTSIDFSV